MPDVSGSLTWRGVAQSGSASGLGPEGRKFESCRPDHASESEYVESEYVSGPSLRARKNVA